MSRLFGAQTKPESDDQESLLSLLDGFQKRTAELHDAFVPVWNARADALKTIVSLSSASIVLSVTFSSSLRQLNAGSAWRYLLIASFTLLTIALITAFLALWWGTRVYKLQARMIDLSPRLRKTLTTPAASPDEFDNATGQIIKDLLRPIYSADKVVAVLYAISGFCFCIAILSLAIIGIARLF